MRIASELTGRVQLPVFPHLLERLIHSRHEPLIELSTLSRFIKMDPGLCFMALRMDRSMSSNPPWAEQAGFDQVISRIGTAGIDALVVQTLSRQAINPVAHQQAQSLAWLWRHCLTTALLAQGIARQLHYQPAEEAYIAGLLHDLGKLALATRTPAACAPLLADPVQAKALFEAEEQVAGSDHNRIGAWLIRRYTHVWHAADAAHYHPIPLARAKEALPLVQMVWAADRLAAESHPGSEASQAATELLNLDPQLLYSLHQAAVEQVLASTEELGVTAEAPPSSRHTHAIPSALDSEITTRTILSGLHAELLTAADADAILRTLRRSLSLFLGIDTVILLTHEPQRDRLVGRLAVGSALPGSAQQLCLPLTAAKSLPALCHISGKPVDSFSRSGPADLTIIDHQLMAFMGKAGFVCWPVPSNSGGRRGCLILGIDGNDWPWVQQQTNLLQAIVTAVSGALEREHRLHDQIHRQISAQAASNQARTRKILHEVNNPLGIIKNCLKVLTLGVDSRLSGIDGIRIINEEITRVAGLLQSLTAPTEPGPKHRESVDVNATIADIVALFRESLSGPTPIVLEQDLDGDIPLIPGDPNLLKQVLMNLLKNSVEAMPQGGTISVSSRRLTALTQNGGHGHPSDRVSISICDDGPGMDDRFKEQLFTPYWTSKAGHDGLGLTIVHEAVLQLQGSLRCESAPGHGTRFVIELPAKKGGSNSSGVPDSVH